MPTVSGAQIKNNIRTINLKINITYMRKIIYFVYSL